MDIVLLDLGLRDAQGLDAISRAHAAAPRVPLVVLTGLDDETFAAQALQEGAQDYLIKGQIETRGLMRALRYAVERKNMEDALFAEKERAEVTLNCIGDAVACSDVSGLVHHVPQSRRARKMTGCSRSRTRLGRPMDRSRSKIVDAASRRATANPMRHMDGPRGRPDRAHSRGLHLDQARRVGDPDTRLPSLPFTTARVERRAR